MSTELRVPLVGRLGDDEDGRRETVDRSKIAQVARCVGGHAEVHVACGTKIDKDHRGMGMEVVKHGGISAALQWERDKHVRGRRMTVGQVVQLAKGTVRVSSGSSE